jgi:hypothetical protein
MRRDANREWPTVGPVCEFFIAPLISLLFAEVKRRQMREAGRGLLDSYSANPGASFVDFAGPRELESLDG